MFVVLVGVQKEEGVWQAHPATFKILGTEVDSRGGDITQKAGGQRTTLSDK